jgi:hypothetical protein
MKYLAFILSIIWTSVSFSQGYSPFTTVSPKRFVNPIDPSDNDYYFLSTLTSFSGDTTTFNQYLRQSDYTVDVTGTACEGWGGMIQPTADTTWLGRQFTYNTLTNELVHNNASSEVLSFDFGLNLGDSAIFYSGVSYDYFIRYDVLNQELVIDSSDWVKTFTIWKYDGLGNLLSSPLNGFEINLSENYGIVSFIDCHSFPSIEKGLTLMGQLNPTIGYYQLTYDEVYPWAPGDTLELRGVNYFQGWGVQTTSHKLITIQNRIETSDSVWIYLNIDTQIEETPSGAPGYPNPYNIYYPNPIIYKKGTNINAYPNKTVIGNTTYMHDSVDNCGTRGRFTAYDEFNFYCDSCDCFIPYDGNGSSANTAKYLEGLGVVYSSVQQYGNWVDYTVAELIYSNVGGLQCGLYVPLGLGEIELDQNRYLVKVVDLLGRETSIQPNTVQIYLYSDGTIEKIFRVE